MDAPFPFGFPGPTAFYLLLFVLTWAVHAIFMSYVLAGTAYLAAVSLFTGGPTVERQRSPMALTLRDWMPFALSATITAGVAPLLFLQVLYKRSFYTANLLLFHRWMAIVPVLIVGFYLLYLLKSKRIGGWPTVVRVIVGCGAFLCMAFTAYSWTENHVLSKHRDVWSSFYESGAIVYRSPELLARSAFWLAAAFPTMAVIVAWQLWFLRGRGQDPPASELRRASLLALAGLLLSVVLGGWYCATAGEAVRRQLTGILAGPYLLLAGAGLLTQAAAWIGHRREPRLSAIWLSLTSAGVLMTLIGVSVARESIRLGGVDIAALYDQHAAAAAVGGRVVFLMFFLLNASLIAWCFILVRGEKGDKSSIRLREEPHTPTGT